MDKLLEAWRSDPRVEPTVELCSMFARACQKPAARDAIPRDLLVSFANDALGRHLDNLDVLVAVGDMYLAAGETELAADVADRARRAHPEEDRTRVLVARVQLLRGKTTRELVSSEDADEKSEGVTLDAPTTPASDEGPDPPTEPQTRRTENVIARLAEQHRAGVEKGGPNLARKETQMGMGLPSAPVFERKRTLQGAGDVERGLALKRPQTKRDEDDVPTKTETQVSSQRPPSLPPPMPPPPASRKDSRRAAVREKRGVGADDPLMMAAIARRNQLAQEAEQKRGESGAPTVKHEVGGDDQATRDFRNQATATLDDDEGTAPTNVRPVLPPPRSPGVPPRPSPIASVDPDEPSTDVQDPTGVSHMVTNVWDRAKGGIGPPPVAPAIPPAVPLAGKPAPAQMTRLEPDEDAIETDLRTLPEHLRQMARGAVGGAGAANASSAPPAPDGTDLDDVVETNLLAVPQRLREVARRTLEERDPDDDDPAALQPRTYIMKPEDNRAAASVDPRPPTRSSLPPSTMIMEPQEPPLRMKPASLPSFGPPPDPLALSGQGPVASMPPGPMDPMGQRSVTHMTPSFTPAPLAISSPPGAYPDPNARSYETERPMEPPRRSTGLYVALGIAIVMVGVLVSYAGYLVVSDYGKTKTAEVNDRTTDAEAKVLAGTPRDISDASVMLSGEGRTLTKQEAETLVRAETLESLDVTGKEGGLRRAIGLVSQLGGTVSPGAELTLAMVDGSASDVERALEKAEATTDDAFAALAAGALLEKRGSKDAASRYERAIGLSPKLASARVRLAHLLLLEGKIARADEQIRALDERSPARSVLLALAWASSKVYGGDIKSRPERLPTSAEVPRVLHGVYAALSVLDAGAGSDASGLCARAITESEAPDVALFFGRLALSRGDRVTAIRAARRALDLSPGLRAAIDLAGRSALDLGKLAEIDDIVQKGPPAATRHLAALKAYELLDMDTLRDLAGATVGERADDLVVKAQLARLKGKPPTETELTELLTSSVTGADLVAVDVFLDQGDLDRARKVIDGWGETVNTASRARRAARLLRYRGDLDEAGLALANAEAGQATLIERVLLDAEIPRQRDRAIEALLRRPSPLEGTLVGKYLETYVRARTDEKARADDMVKELEPPTSTANLPSRICAALAFAETKDKRGESLVRALLQTYPKNLDVMRAAARFGFIEMQLDDP